jgi:hypothetical protein
MEIVIVAAIVLVVVVFIVNSPKKVAEVPSRVPSKIPSQVPSQLQKKENPKVEMPFVSTEEFSEILDLLKNTNDSIFITGKAGTGKSSLLKHFVGHPLRGHHEVPFSKFSTI